MNRNAEAIKILYNALKERWAIKLLFWVAAENPTAIIKAAATIQGGHWIK